MKAELEARRLVSTHWGAYEVVDDGKVDAAHTLFPLVEDPDPSPIGLAMLQALRGPERVARPAIRSGWLAERERRAASPSDPDRTEPGTHTGNAEGETVVPRQARGGDAFVEVPWDEALDLVADELQRVRRYEPVEWLGSTEEVPVGKAHEARHTRPANAAESLHLISDQPATRLHSQLDFSVHSRDAKIGGREPVWINPRDAAARDIRDGDIVRLFNERGQCLAGAVVTSAMAPRVLRLSTGAWWDPLEPGVAGSLDKHGNPNVLTRDAPTSGLSQGCAAQSFLVNVERSDSEPPPVTAFDPPRFVEKVRRRTDTVGRS